ncbi:MAG: C10 family peptidase [Bacteroidales bacterium]|nr:C10 family peptidase [Bacteroidales bacterium]
MKRFFTILFLSCTVVGWAQQPLLTTKWTQELPYNQYCPADPLENNKHCYAGCPAVVMGQILNYLRTTQDTRFDDGDDYNTGNYFGRQFQIDDDWDTYDFPSFPQLNAMLDSVDARFQRGEGLPDTLKAAVVFACGVACKQVYSASDSYGSGTFSVNQAFEAYQRFGFENCQLLWELDSTARAILISNIQAGYPVHLAIENPAGTSGHNVVVDGYRESDGKFHINFGWGGYKDNWYNLPDPGGFSYGWTKIEGIIVNIIPTASLAVNETASPQPLEVYPNPASEVLYLKGLSGEVADYAVYNALGQKVASGSTHGNITVAELGRGLYLLQIKGDKYFETARFVVE